MLEGKMISKTQRSVNLDVIRCVAIFSVVGVHVFANIPFYGEPFTGPNMWFMTILRTSCMVCVPLFALLSGYLCIHKKLSKGYYKKLIPILLTYLMACFLAFALQISWGARPTIREIIFNILNTSGGAVGYSWYIEMYIGLFMLIPFLNAAYHGMETQKNKQILILVMLMLTTVPSLLNIHDWSSIAAFFRSGNPETSQNIFPAWWDSMWPVTYYFIGAYIREYDIPLPKKWNFLILVGWLICVGSFLFYKSYGETGLYEPSLKWGAFDKLIHSVLLFLLLIHQDFSKVPEWLCNVFARISKLSLGIYLCSYTTDIYVYENLSFYASTTREVYRLAPLCLLASFGLAIIAAQIIQWVIDFPRKLKR